MSFFFIIFGTGSIASRHGKVLKNLGCEIKYVSRSKIKSFQNSEVIQYEDVKKYNPDYWLICVPSSLHDKICKMIRSFSKKKIFCEKPGPMYFFKNVRVLYNLRYLACVKKIKKQFKQKSKINLIHRVNAKKWSKNWRSNYVFVKSLGGGSILTNSHELDIYNYISNKKIKLTDIKYFKNIKDIKNNKIVDFIKIKNNFVNIELSINSKSPMRLWEIKNGTKKLKFLFYKNNQTYKKKRLEEINKTYIEMWKSEFQNKSILPNSTNTKWICELNKKLKL